MQVAGLDGLCVPYPKLLGNMIRLGSEPSRKDQVKVFFRLAQLVSEIVLIIYDRYFRSA